MSDLPSKTTAAELLAKLPGEISERWPRGARSVVTWVVFWGPEGGERA